MRKKIEEKIQQLKAVFKKEKPAPFTTVEEVTRASRKSERMKSQANTISRAAMGIFTIGSLAMAGLTVAGVAIAGPAVGAATLGLMALFGAGFYQEYKVFKLDDRILEAKGEDGRYIRRTYSEQETAKLEADHANKSKLEKKRDVLSKVATGLSVVALVGMVGAIVGATAGLATPLLQTAFLGAWAVWGSGEYVKDMQRPVSNRISKASSYHWNKDFEERMARIDAEREAEPAAGLDNAPTAGKDFDAKAGKDSVTPAAEQPAPAAKPAKAPKGPSK